MRGWRETHVFFLWVGIILGQPSWSSPGQEHVLRSGAALLCSLLLIFPLKALSRSFGEADLALSLVGWRGQGTQAVYSRCPASLVCTGHPRACMPRLPACSLLQRAQAQLPRAGSDTGEGGQCHTLEKLLSLRVCPETSS